MHAVSYAIESGSHGCKSHTYYANVYSIAISMINTYVVVFDL